MNLSKAGYSQRCCPPPPAQLLPSLRTQAGRRDRARAGHTPTPRKGRPTLPSPAEPSIPRPGQPWGTCRGPAPPGTGSARGAGVGSSDPARAHGDAGSSRSGRGTWKGAFPLSGTGSARPGSCHFPWFLQGRRLPRAVPRACDLAALGNPHGHARIWRGKSASTYLLATWIPLTVLQASPKAEER